MTDELDDLQSRRKAIEGQVGKNSKRGSAGKIALAAALAGGVGVGGYMVADFLGQDREPATSIPVSGTVDFPEDRSARDSLELPRVPNPIVIDRPVIQTEVDTATLARLKELEAKLEAAEALAQNRENETEQERELREKLQSERDLFASDIAALRSSAQNDQERARELQAELIARLDKAQDDFKAQVAAFETAKVTAEAKAKQDALERQMEFNRRLEEARRADPLEQERLRLEAQRLEDERARLDELAKSRAARQQQEEQRITSSMLALNNSSVDEAGAAEGRELSDNESFVQRRAETVAVARATRIYNPQATVPQGAMIQTSLETAIDSTLPGPIRAIVSEDVHSLDGSAVLIPAGSKVFGEYSAGIALGQRRILIVWTRVLTPSNRSISIASYGADRLGRSGTGGKVDTRFGTKFAGAAAISIIGAAPALIAGQSDSTATSDALENVGEDLTSTTSSAIGEYLSIPPTIFVKQGSVVTIVLDRDVEIF